MTLGQLLGGGADYTPAAHWWSRLQAEHAPEMAQAHHYDRIEGSAEYTALIHSALADLGCDAADDDLLDLAIDNLTVVLTVPTAALEVTADLATAKTPELAFENLGVVAVDDANGLPWLCPVAGGGAGKAPAPEPTLELHPLRAPGTAPHEQRYIVRGHDADSLSASVRSRPQGRDPG